MAGQPHSEIIPIAGCIVLIAQERVILQHFQELHKHSSHTTFPFASTHWAGFSQPVAQQFYANLLTTAS